MTKTNTILSRMTDKLKQNNMNAIKIFSNRLMPILTAAVVAGIGIGAFWGNVATSMLAWDTSRPFYYLGFWKEKKFKGIALTINF